MADKQAVPNGAYLLCDKGAKPGQLTVTPNGVSYYGEPSATEFDVLPVLNVPDFGACLILKKCVPATAQWQDVVENGVIVGRGRPLKEDSVLPCTVGGTVHIFLSLAAATAAASNHAAAEDAKEKAQAAKKEAGMLFWAGVGVAAVVGIAAIALTGGAAAPLVALAAEVALDAAVSGAVAGAVAGGVAGGIEGYNSGGLEGAAEGIVPGAAAGAVMGGTAGVVTALGGGALLLPSVAAFGYGVYQDSRALYYAPSVANGLVVFADVVTVAAAAKTEAAVRRGLAPEPAPAPAPVPPPRLVATPHPTTAMTNAEKGIYGEHVSDVYMANRGHTKLNDGGRLTQVGDAPRGTGIDGVWRNPNPPPEFIITDAKYGTSQPKMTADGKQMSEKWVKGSNRLERATGLRQSQDIEDAMTRNTVERQLHQIGTDGSVTVKVLDAQGTVTSTKPPVQP